MKLFEEILLTPFYYSHFLWLICLVDTVINLMLSYTNCDIKPPDLEENFNKYIFITHKTFKFVNKNCHNYITK